MSINLELSTTNKITKPSKEMEREIKYRGRQRYTGKWIYGHVFCLEDTWRIQPQGYKEAWHEVDPETIGQFTGLKDKNGKEIYEGDILTNINRIEFEMKWEMDGRISTNGGWTHYSPRNVFWVKGNIYEDNLN